MSKPDLIIRNGTVVDGTGGPIRIADVVIRDGVVSDITESASTLATKEIDADGAWVTPGFIDPTHTWMHNFSGTQPVDRLSNTASPRW